MALTQEEIATIVEVVSSRMTAREAELKTEFYTAVEALRRDFYEVVQQLGQNQTNLYEMMATRFDPGVLLATAQDFWRRSIMAEAERITVEVEGDWWEQQVDKGDAPQVGDGPMFEEPEDEVEEAPEVPTIPTAGMPKEKPQR